MDQQVYDIKNGYVLLLGVLIIGAGAVVVGISLLVLGNDFARTNFLKTHYAQARALADACADEALMVLNEDQNFLGNGSLVLGEGNCSYTVVDKGGDKRNILSTGTVNNTIRKVQVEIKLKTDKIDNKLWQEVADFN